MCVCMEVREHFLKIFHLWQRRWWQQLISFVCQQHFTTLLKVFLLLFCGFRSFFFRCVCFFFPISSQSFAVIEWNFSNDGFFSNAFFFSTHTSFTKLQYFCVFSFFSTLVSVHFRWCASHALCFLCHRFLLFFLFRVGNCSALHDYRVNIQLCWNKNGVRQANNFFEENL